MVTLLLALAAYVRAFFVSRHKLALEAVALRQQLAVFKRKQARPKLRTFDRMFWIALRHLWPGWTEALIIVKPETVVSWHRAGFRLVLAIAVEFPPAGTTENQPGDPPIDSAHEGGQSGSRFLSRPYPAICIG